MRKFGFLILLFITLGIFASDQGNKVAKVIILKGEVFELGEGSSRVLKKGDWVIEGRSLKSSSRSFVKLLFIDKSQMSLGANSEMKIKEFPRNKAGIIDLIRGKVRAKVTKNYMEIGKAKSKLFIKTKTAAMGVRGTDFQVLYNPGNKVTSLLTFEGAVAMTKISERMQEAQVNQRSLERRLNAPQAVMVRQGQYSGSTPGKERVSVPVKISPTQLESLKGSSASTGIKNSRKESQGKKSRSIIPPGIDAKKLAAVSSNSIDSALESSVGSDKMKNVEVNTQAAIAESRDSGPPPEGFLNDKTGAHAPASGGFIDDKSGLYIPPPEGSAFDANAGVYVPSPEVGSVDSETGKYLPPEGLKPTMKNDQVVFTGTSSGRGPASAGEPAGFVPKAMGSASASKPVVKDLLNTNDMLRDVQREVNETNNSRNAVLQTGRARVKFRISR
jgi:hypothetical protein